MNWIKLLGWYGLSIPILFFAGDFLLTRYILDVDTDVDANFNVEKQYRIQHPYYNHTLLENYDGYGKWGKEKYRVCTDELGMKTKCEYFIDLFSKFAESVYHDYHIAGDVHFNEKGNVLIFTALRETFNNP